MASPFRRGITRRSAVLGVPLAVAAGVAFRWRDPAPAGISPRDSRKVTIVPFTPAGVALEPVEADRVVRSDAEWWALLTPQQYYVARRHDTDPPFTGTYYLQHAPGLYRCVCCATAVFGSDSKYDSGTGWPSFWRPLDARNIRQESSPPASLTSGIEVGCSLCEAHLGHVFDDGPAPTGLRYCINQSSLLFASF